MELENSSKYENTAGFMGTYLLWRGIDVSDLYWKAPLKTKIEEKISENSSK